MNLNSSNIVASHLPPSTTLDLVAIVNPLPNHGVRAALDPREDLLLLLNSDMVVQQVRRVLDPKGHAGSDEAERDGSVADHPEGVGVGLLERRAGGGDDGRRCARDAVERERHADGVLDDGRDEGAQVRRVEPGADGGTGEVVAQVLVGDRRQDGAEDGVADGAACRAEGPEEAGADAELLDRDKQAGGDVCEGGNPSVRLVRN